MKRTHIMAVAVVGCGCLLALDSASGQDARHVGPTLQARAATARSHLPNPAMSPSVILDRHAALERDMAMAFGLPMLTESSGPGFRAGLVHDVGRWMATRWNDSVFDAWAENALLTYWRIEESAQFEANGFHMGVDVDDIAKGRFGVRVNRALE